MPLRTRLGSVAIVTVFALTACPGPETDPIPMCADAPAETCAPLFEPVYERIHDEVLVPRCSLPGGSCHGEAGAAGAAGGLVITTDVSATHEILLDGFVEPSDPECSPLTVRMNTTDADAVMPPGSQRLDEGVRCTVAQWIASGAQR